MIGQSFNHKFNPSLSCKVTAETKKGYQVQQTEKKGKKVKTIQTYYYKIDFDKDKGLWVPARA